MSTIVIAEEQSSQFSSESNRCQCSECVEVRRRTINFPDRAPELYGDKGTVIRWDWRSPECTKVWVLISCHGCGHDKFVRKQTILNIYKGKRSWKGLCSDCSRNTPLHKKFKGRHRNRFDAVIDFDKTPHERNRYWVYCPNYSTCRGLEQRRVDKYNLEEQPFHCSSCFRAARSENASAAWSALRTVREGAAIGNGQTNEAIRLLLEAVKAVASAWEQVKFGVGSFEHGIKKIDLLVIGGELGVLLDPYDDVKSRNRVARKLTKLSVYELFPSTHGGCPAFVKTVVDGIERGELPDGVARRLWNLRPARKTPA